MRKFVLELLKIGDVVLELNGLKCEGEYVVLPTGDRQKVSDYLKKFQGDLTFTVQPLFDDEKGYKTQVRNENHHNIPVQLL